MTVLLHPDISLLLSYINTEFQKKGEIFLKLKLNYIIIYPLHFGKQF